MPLVLSSLREVIVLKWTREVDQKIGF